MREKATKAQSRLREVQAEPQEARKPSPSDTDLQRWIAEAAYYRAESRGFHPGAEAQDWLAAETEILARLRGGNGVL
jgi:aspartate oxidase